MVLARISLLEDGYEISESKDPTRTDISRWTNTGRGGRYGYPARPIRSRPFHSVSGRSRNEGDIHQPRNALRRVGFAQHPCTVCEACLYTACTKLTRGSPNAIAWLHTSPLTNRLRGSDAGLSLRYLEKVLQQYDSADTHYAYRTAVANTFFALNSNKRGGWRMPAWLVSWEMERNPEGWVGMAVKWGWIEEALDWSAEMLRRVSHLSLLASYSAHPHAADLVMPVGFPAGSRMARKAPLGCKVKGT